MVYNPSYVGKTHVVTLYDPQGGNRGNAELHEVLGVHANYKSARETVDAHLGTKAKRFHQYRDGDVVYAHPDADEGDITSARWYRIHAEDGKGGFKKV